MPGTMTRSDIRTFTRMLLAESSASRWSDTDLNNLINYGAEDFALKTQILQDIDTQAIVASQEQYDLPTDYLTILKIEVRRGSTVYILEPLDRYEFFESTTPITGVPDRYWIFQEDLFIHPRYGTADQTTTLNGALTSTATTITVASTASFSSIGRIIVNSEAMNYTGTTSTTFTGVTRALEGTIAAAHSDGDTVRQRGLWIYFVKKPALLTSDTGTLGFPSQFDRAPAFYAAWISRMKSRDWDLAEQNRQVYESHVQEGKLYIKKFWRDKVVVPK